MQKEVTGEFQSATKKEDNSDIYQFSGEGRQSVQPIKKPVRTLSIFKSMAFVKDVKGISFKNRLKGLKCFHQSKVK
jgi:hypothetical protein